MNTTTSVTHLERNRCSNLDQISWRADWIRLEVLDLIERAGLGHYASAFSAAEIYATLYYHSLRIDPSNPGWPDRDRFLLGKGHAATGLWPILSDLGFFPREWLQQFGSIGSPVTDHPNMRTAPGIDFSSGSLGHNLSVGVGMAVSARVQHLSFRTFVLTGDGELQEGQIWEAAMAASHFRLGNLVAIVDANGFSASGPTSVAMNVEPIAGRFQAFGWRTVELADGHDVGAITQAIAELPEAESPKPTCIIARTQKGHGVSFMEKSPQRFHIGLLTPEERRQAEQEIRARMARHEVD